MSTRIFGVVQAPKSGHIWHRTEFQDMATAQAWAAQAPQFRHITTQEQEPQE